MANETNSRILLMDDDEMVQRIVMRTLQRLGYEVAVAGDGAGALSLYAKALHEGSPFSAVILDLTVPEGMGGCETLQRLRSIDPAVRAIASSGYAVDSGSASLGCTGFAAVLPKPFAPSDLALTVAQLLAR